MSIVRSAAAAPRGVWGQCESGVARYGEARTVLRIFPPDITPAERAQWRMLHVWPPLGFAVAVAVTVIGAGPLGLGGALVLAVLLWLAPLTVCWVAAQPLLSRIHEQWATSLDAGDAPCRELDELGRRLRAAEDRWRRGAASADDFRREWRAAYDAVPAG